MKPQKQRFEFAHGNVEGVYYRSDTPNVPLVIITNGQNGFYSYGMFPYIQQRLHEAGISSLSYNFSHGGIKGGEDVFTALNLYEKNCMRLETADLVDVVKAVRGSSNDFADLSKLVLFTHSLGSIPTVFAANQLIEEGHIIDGIVLVAGVKSLDRWPPEVIEEWERTGVRLLRNNRTKQDLPQGKELLKEVKEANGKWKLENAIKSVNTEYLIIHGDEDEAVDVHDAYAIHKWTTDAGFSSQLHIIKGAGHTFKTKHPFEGPTKELEELISTTVDWIQKLC